MVSEGQYWEQIMPQRKMLSPAMPKVNCSRLLCAKLAHKSAIIRQSLWRCDQTGYHALAAMNTV